MSTEEPAFRSVLVPERQGLWLHLGCSTFVHGAGVALMLLFTVAGGWCRGPAEPVLLDTIQVSVVSLPKSATNVPDRLQRVKRDAGEQPTPEPVREKPPEKVSDLKVKTPDAKPDPGADNAREQLLRDMERQKLLDDMMNAPEGAVDRNATDPDGTADAQIAALGVGGKGDPEYLAWQSKVQALLMKQFKPLSAITDANPDILAVVTLVVDTESGRITSYETTGPSGVAAYDLAAERAVAAVPAIPLPPEKYLPLVAQGVSFRFRPNL